MDENMEAFMVLIIEGNNILPRIDVMCEASRCAKTRCAVRKVIFRSQNGKTNFLPSIFHFILLFLNILLTTVVLC